MRRVCRILLAAGLLALAAGCGTPDIERYPGGTDQPYTTSNGAPIHLPQEEI